jgi:pyruvate dehydrogenase E1 component alpha subunit
MERDLTAPRSSLPCTLNPLQFYECLNMAALYKLPHIFVVENNKWAIGMNHPRATSCTKGDSEPYIYKKGPAFGMVRWAARLF